MTAPKEGPALLRCAGRRETRMTRPKAMIIGDEAGDDSVPRDIDELRRELTRRVQKLLDAARNNEAETFDSA